MNAIVNEMMLKLNEVFLEFNDRMIKESLEWLEVQHNKYVEYCASDESRDRSIDYFVRRNKAINMAGGKYYYELFQWRLEEAKIRFEKKLRKVIEARNVTISNKLLKAEVKEIIDSEFVVSYDGFNGTYQVNTDKGPKKVSINTVYAGGYNIQCFHLRVLVKVK